MKVPEDIQYILSQLLKRPVAFFPVFARIGGSVNAGVMLSQLWYWSDGRARNKEGWIWKTSEEWFIETVLSVSEIEGARKKLIERGLIRYKRAGLPAKPHYQLNKAAILEAITALQTNQNFSLPKSVKQDYSKSKNKLDMKRTSNLSERGKHKSESSAESSTESLMEPTPTTCKADYGGGGGFVESDNRAFIEELVDAALWLAKKMGQVRHPIGFKAVVRRRLCSEGPSPEDIEALELWRTSNTVSAEISSTSETRPKQLKCPPEKIQKFLDQNPWYEQRARKMGVI